MYTYIHCVYLYTYTYAYMYICIHTSLKMAEEGVIECVLIAMDAHVANSCVQVLYMCIFIS